MRLDWRAVGMVFARMMPDRWALGIDRLKVYRFVHPSVPCVLASIHGTNRSGCHDAFWKCNPEFGKHLLGGDKSMFLGKFSKVDGLYMDRATIVERTTDRSVPRSLAV
jgi:hypothetical protein